MSVEISNTDGTKKYVWKGAGFSWKSATSKKPWNGVYSNNYLIKIEEMIGYTGGFVKRRNVFFEEEFCLCDSYCRVFDKNFKEVIEISEDVNRSARFTRTILESFNVCNALEKCLEKNFTSSIGMGDSLHRTIHKNIIEKLDVTENLERKAVYIRMFSEAISCAEVFSKKYKKNINESMNIIESYLRNANAALSDMYVSTQDLSFEEFKEISMPVGYKPFKEFVIGDYEYKEALFRMIVEGAITEGRPLITDWLLNVDVPDTNDRGTVDVPKAGVRVDFKKRFYDVPEVNVILRGATDSVPEYDVDDTGFFVQLKSGDAYIAGTISWSANGF